MWSFITVMHTWRLFFFEIANQPVVRKSLNIFQFSSPVDDACIITHYEVNNKKNKLNCRTDAHKLHTFKKRKMWDLWPNTAGFTSFRLAPIYRNCKFLILNQTGHTAQSIFRAALKAEEIKQVSLTLGKWQISAQSFAVCRRKRKALSWMWHALCSIGPQQARIGSL